MTESDSLAQDAGATVSANVESLVSDASLTTEPAAAAAPTTKSGAVAASPTDWRARQAKKKAAKRAEKKWYSEPLSALGALAAVVLAILLASLFTGLVENGNQLPQAITLAQINAQPDVDRTTVGIGETGTATLVWSAELGSSVMLLTDLDPLPENSVYQFWYVTAGGPVSAGTIGESLGGAESWKVLDGTMTRTTNVSITIEPAGGSDKPTTDPISVIQP